MRALSVVTLLFFVACTPDPGPQRERKPHPWFEIDTGVHALGSTATDGEIKCTSCHALTNTNFAQFACVGCHEHSPERAAQLHGAVPEFKYESAACYACHPTAPGSSDPLQDVAVTALVPTWSNTTIVSVTPAELSLPMGMNHSSPQPEEARTACANCHVNADLANFYPGQFHGALLTLMLPQPTQCAGCHRASAPEGFVGPVVTSRTPPSGEMKHDAVVWAAGAPTSTPVLTADCSTCHVAPSLAGAASWRTNASFHQALAASAQAQPSSCLDCHANTRPGVVTLPTGIKFDHRGAAWLGDCATCHRAGFSSWAGGTFHPPGVATPTSCLPCHEPRRPTSAQVVDPPFDFGTNAQGITHGGGQDCAVCHRQDGGPQPDWSGGHFSHASTTIAANTCVACHSTQRPTTTVVSAACLDGGSFDHPANGGDCFGCHQDTDTFTQLSDWACGVQYPGANLMSSTDQFITVTELNLRRGGPNNLVTGTTSIRATLYNAMLHTAAAIPSDAGIAPGPLGDGSTCWHCHASASFVNGRFHESLTNFRATPDAGITALPQPTAGCSDCHSNMRPSGIVQPDAGVPALRAMNHAVDGGAALDCSGCHASPGATWADGVFHANVAGTSEDCTECHYPLMAEPAQADVSRAPGYKMQHRSTQLTFQRCDLCHPGALANATTAPAAASWSPGTFHASLTAQPSACVDCHQGVTNPMQATQSALNGQWMNHALAVVTAKDCAFCHANDAAAGSWSTSTRFHLAGISPSSCQGCHGPANGGEGNNVPAGLVDSATITSASASTGRAGVNVQLSHADVNVSSRDCNFCHTQPGTNWSAATFHARFRGGAALLMNGTTGRCSNCHLNVKPDATFTAADHSGFSGSGIDCSACHAWPGTGSAAAPNWRRPGAAAAPSIISVGGFTIPQPPAPNAATIQAGVNALPHPSVSGACTNCHAQASGGRGARAYDHALAPATGCSSCHEAGSDLVATPWTLNAPGAMELAAQCGRGGGTVADRGGDTRPIGLTTLACSANATNVQNHFYPSDCGECHVKPAGVATTQTGATYVSNWRFQHYFGAPARQATCCHCHGGASCP